MGASHFSFNIAGGRCEECQGEGFIKVGMQFMADVEPGLRGLRRQAFQG